MKSRMIVILYLVILTGCISTSDYDELVAENQVLREDNKKLSSEIKNKIANIVTIEEQYNEELKGTQSEIEKLEIKNQTSENEINLTKDEKRIINFYNDTSFNMYHGVTDSRVKIKVELTEPVRALPTTNSPYYMRGLTYSTTDDLGNKFQKGTFEGELIYTTTDSGKFFKRWCLVIIEGTMGYVPEDSIIEFTNVEYSYDTKESLVGLELGMSVDKLEEMYSNNFEHIINKSDYLRFIKIEIDGKAYLNAIYNPNTRIVEEFVVRTQDIPLTSGFKVGDKSQNVFEYYDELYEQVDLDFDFGNEHRIYDIGDGYWLVIDGENGVVNYISFSNGYINLF